MRWYLVLNPGPPFVCIPARTLVAWSTMVGMRHWLPRTNENASSKRQAQGLNAQNRVEQPNGCSIDPTQVRTGRQEVEGPNTRSTTPNMWSNSPTYGRKTQRKVSNIQAKVERPNDTSIPSTGNKICRKCSLVIVS